MEIIKLSFGTFIALFIPGFFLLCSIIIRYEINSHPEIKPIIESGSLVAISVGTILALIVGLVIDSVRLSLSWLLRISPTYDAWVTIDLSNATSDDREHYNWIIENHFRYHQFYINLSLCFFISAFLICNVWDRWWLLIVLSIPLAASAVYSFKTTITHLRSRFIK